MSAAQTRACSDTQRPARETRVCARLPGSARASGGLRVAKHERPRTRAPRPPLARPIALCEALRGDSHAVSLLDPPRGDRTWPGWAAVATLVCPATPPFPTHRLRGSHPVPQRAATPRQRRRGRRECEAAGRGCGDAGPFLRRGPSPAPLLLSPLAPGVCACGQGLPPFKAREPSLPRPSPQLLAAGLELQVTPEQAGALSGTGGEELLESRLEGAQDPLRLRPRRESRVLGHRGPHEGDFGLG